MAVRQSMPTAGDRAAASSSTPLSSRRLISRITSPFASKSRSVTDYFIDIANPHRQYRPGDTVSGSVKLRVVRPIRITHLVVCLHGYVQVYKTPGAPPADGHRANNAYVGTGRGKKSGEYFGNGFASLFEDERVLCGDGRLPEGMYQFDFNLQFPERDLPSSIDFERGTISYMITATLTRPVAIAPIMHCDRPVNLKEQIDISHLDPPKARTITLEPISRRTRARQQARKTADPSADRRSRVDEFGADSSERRESATSSSPSVRVDGDAAPRSPAPSEISFDSLGSTSQQDSNTNSGRNSESVKANGSKISLAVRTITATVQTLTRGCLAGDSIPVKISINHTKHIKSLYGVIITLYRQARVDLHPSIPLGPIEKGKEGKYEDYYPKSLTGLGGLSLSGAGSSHVFRKDLAQVMLPLMVDPRSLTAEINGRIQVPENSFPTISTVPGAMISFRYYIEVLLDIQGRLSAGDRNLGSVGGFASTTNGAPSVDSTERERGAYHSFGASIVDTAAIRRDKGVVACAFEVIVGTKDSARGKGKKKVELVHPTPATEPKEPPSRRSSPQDHHTQSVSGNDAQHQQQQHQYQQPQHQHQHQHQHPNHPGAEHYSSNSEYDHYWYGDHAYNQGYHYGYDYYGYDMNNEGYAYAGHSYQSAPQVPMPKIEDESQLPEKERLRRAEARLLPSEPPVIEEQAGEAGFEATAPYLPDEQHGHHASGYEMPPIPIITATSPSHAASSAGHFNHMMARTPDYEPRQQPGLPLASTDDEKRAMELRVPSVELESQAAAGASTSLRISADGNIRVPSTLGATNNNDEDDNEDEDNGYSSVNDSHADASASRGLPRYEQ